MVIKRISGGEMPPENKYILIYCGLSPWHDHRDQVNVYWKFYLFKIINKWRMRNVK